MRTVYLESMGEGKPTFHVISFPWSYTQLVSLNGFENRMNHAYLRAKDNIERQRCCWSRITQRDFERRKGNNQRIPVVRHDSMWDFYEHIGYWYQKSSVKKVVWK